MMAEEQKIMNRHMLLEVVNFFHIGEIKANQTKMLDVRITLVDIAIKGCIYLQYT